MYLSYFEIIEYNHSCGVEITLMQYCTRELEEELRKSI